MNESKITVRYARALLKSAVESEQIEQVNKDIEQMLAVFGHSTDLNNMLKSPIIKSSLKGEILTNIFKDSFCKLTISFIELITANKREIFLNLICRNFINLYRDYKGIKTAQLTTAIAVSESVIAKIENLIRENFHTEVELTHTVDSNIIGGFILRVEDSQINASISSKLENIKRRLVEAPFTL